MANPDNAQNIPQDKEEEYMAAGSYQQEVHQDLAKEGLEGDDATRGGTDPEDNKGTTNGRKEPPDTTGTNPKRTENSREN